MPSVGDAVLAGRIQNGPKAIHLLLGERTAKRLRPHPVVEDRAIHVGFPKKKKAARRRLDEWGGKR